MFANVLRFLVIYLVLTVGFAGTFSVLLSAQFYGFRTWASAILTLIQMTFGNVNWDFFNGLNDQYVMGLVVLYMFTSFILLLNLLIAMFNQSYSEVIAAAELEFLLERAKLLSEYHSFNIPWVERPDDPVELADIKNFAVISPTLLDDVQADLKKQNDIPLNLSAPLPAESDRERELKKELKKENRKLLELQSIEKDARKRERAAQLELQKENHQKIMEAVQKVVESQTKLEELVNQTKDSLNKLQAGQKTIESKLESDQKSLDQKLKTLEDLLNKKKKRLFS